MGLPHHSLEDTEDRDQESREQEQDAAALGDPDSTATLCQSWI